MDIGSKNGGVAGRLSNFTPRPFVLDEVEISSMEGFLQSLKFSNPEMQKEICKLTGFKAKKAGSKKNWKRTRKLYWQGQEFDRDSDEYQELLDRAYYAILENQKFKKDLLATGNANLTHSIGRQSKKETILTRNEFCSRLMKMRKELQDDEQFEF